MGADILKKAIYLLSAVASIFLGTVFVSSDVYAQEEALSLAEIKSIPGYKSYSTLSSFTKHLQEDPVLYKALSSNQQLSEKILSSTTLQRKLLSDIKKSGDSQSVVSSYVNEFTQTGDATGNAFGQIDNGQTDSFARQEEQRQKRRKLNQQQLSGDDGNKDRRNSQRLGGTNGNANLAAQRAIEQAQRDREAADRRAEEMIAKAQTQLDVQNEQENFQAEMLRFKAVQDMISQIAHDPAALDAFWADTQMHQKLMDNEMTNEDAMAKLGVTPPPVIPGTTAPAPEPTPNTTPDPADDIIFGDGFEGGDNAGLVHVSGNRYKLNGSNVWDTKHAPDSSEYALDANGWPKYLNVPAECPPPRAHTKYLDHIPFLSVGNAGAHEIYSKKAMAGRAVLPNRINGYTRLRQDYFATGQGINEEIYSSFYTGHTEAQGNYRAITDNLGNAKFVLSISHCPGDFSGITPTGENQLPDTCFPSKSKEYVDHWIWSHMIGYHLSNSAATVNLSNDCWLLPGKRYFMNIISSLSAYYERIHPAESEAAWSGSKYKKQKVAVGRISGHGHSPRRGTSKQGHGFNGIPEAAICSLIEKKGPSSETIECKDTYNILPPVVRRAELQCNNGKGKKIFVDNYNGPHLTNYKCVASIFAKNP